MPKTTRAQRDVKRKQQVDPWWSDVLDDADLGEEAIAMLKRIRGRPAGDWWNEFKCAPPALRAELEGKL